MQNTKKELEDYLKSEIAKSGFPLEIWTASILTKLEWTTTPHIFFYDDDAKNYREMDIHAKKQSKIDRDVDDVLIIECKKQENKPWVFF